MIKIQVVGSGCANCNRLEELCRDIVTENHVNAEIEKVTDINKFADLGIMMTPGLLINGKIVSSGKVPEKSIIQSWILEANL